MSDGPPAPVTRARPERRRPPTRPGRRAMPARIGHWVRIRIYVAGAVITALFSAIGYTAHGLQVHESERYRKLAQRQHLHTIEVPAPRGPIVDVKGRELAVTADADSVFANPREVQGLAHTAETLATILDLDVRALEAKLASRRYFAWIDRHISADKARAIRDADLKGIYLTPEPRRFYPGKSLAGPVLGLAGIDGNGLDGIELKLDTLLRGERAKFAALRDASGRIMLADGLVKPRPGASITLTIDRAVQYIAEEALEDAVLEHDAKAGSLVVLDVSTGEVLAMANWPSYDPNAPGRAVQTKARNRAVTDAFEIGSVMKVFTVAAALDSGVFDTREHIDVEGGRIKVGRKLIRDTYRDDELTVGGIIKRSSNVGAIKVAQRLGKDALYQALERYGFGSETGIELPGERSGRIRDPRRWGQVGLASISFGYGLTVTTLQIAAGFAAIGNGGTYHEPRIVREVVDASGAVLYHHDPMGRRVLQESTAAALLPILASVFDKGRDGGTARSLDSPSFGVGGKTGTARKVDPQTREYSKELHVSSFAGLAPIDDPRIAVVVVIDEPRGEHYYGGQVAGPAFVRVVDETLRYLGVPPKPGADGAPPARPSQDGERAPDHDEPENRPPAITDVDSEFQDLEPGPLAGDMVVIPDFTGMSVKRALDVARRAGVAVDIEGSGRAVSQVPPPGPAPWPGECHITFARSTPSPAGAP